MIIDDGFGIVFLHTRSKFKVTEGKRAQQLLVWPTLA